MAEQNPNQQSKKNSFNQGDTMGSMNNSMNNTMHAMNSFMDLSNLRQQFAKNMEALNHTNQIATDLLKNLTNRSSEMVQNSIKSMIDMAHNVASNHSIDETRTKQANAASSTFNELSSQAKQASEQCHKAANDVLNVCTNRVSEAFSEFSKKSQ